MSDPGCWASVPAAGRGHVHDSAPTHHSSRWPTIPQHVGTCIAGPAAKVLQGVVRAIQLSQHVDLSHVITPHGKQIQPPKHSGLHSSQSHLGTFPEGAQRMHVVSRQHGHHSLRRRPSAGGEQALHRAAPQVVRRTHLTVRDRAVAFRRRPADTAVGAAANSVANRSRCGGVVDLVRRGARRVRLERAPECRRP